MPELTSMMNIGREMERKLKSVGIELSEDTKKELKEFSNFLKNISKVNFCLSDSYHCKHYKVQVFFYQPAFYTLPELQKYSIVVDREHI